MKNKIVMKDDKGKKREFKVLFCLEDSESEKNYLIYTEDKKNKDGKVKAFASTYILSEKGNMTKLKPVSNDEEFVFIEKVLDSLQKVELGGK